MTPAELGAAFESRIAAYYEALGFKIDRNVQLREHQIDLLVTRHVPGANILSYMIEAKFRESGSVSKEDVTAFVNVARDLIHLEEISGAVMITNTSFSKNAAGKAFRSKTIKLLTIHQLEIEIFATSESLLRVCADYERSKILNEYIPLSGVKYLMGQHEQSKTVNIQDVGLYLRKWADGDNNLITLIGDFGSGKTTIMGKIFYELAKSRIDTGSGRYPIQLKLRSLLSHNSLWAFVSSSLRDGQYILPERSVYEAMLAAGGLIFLLDGFDEIHTSATAVERAEYLKRLLPILGSPCPCIISTRPTYFANFREMYGALQNLLEPPVKFERLEQSPFNLNWLLDRLNISKAEIIPARILTNLIQIEPMDERHILKYLRIFGAKIKESTGDNEESFLENLYKIYDIKDLLRRPLLLNMIVVTIIEGGLDISRAWSKIGPSTLYDLYTQLCARRDASNRPSTKRIAQVLTPEERLAGCRELALAMLRKGSIELQAREVNDAVARVKIASKKVIANVGQADFRERILTDIRLCSFLSFSDDGKFRFAHKSFFEFFVAQQLVIEIGKRLAVVSEFARLNIPKEVIGFLGSYARDVESFARHVKMAFFNQGNDGAEVDALFHRTVVASGVLLETVHLFRKKILDVELRRAAITGARFEKVSLCRVDLEDITAAAWSFRGVSLEESAIESAIFKKSDLDLHCERAKLRDVQFEDCRLAIKGPSLDLENVKMQGGSVLLDVHADLRGLHLETVERLALGPMLQLGINTNLTVSNTTVVHAAPAHWYGAAARISFSRCVLLGVFLTSTDLEALLDQEPGAVSVDRCKGVIFTRGAKKEKLKRSGYQFLQAAEELMVVDAGDLDQALRERSTATRPLSTDAVEKRERAFELLAAVKAFDVIASRADQLFGPLAYVFDRKPGSIRPVVQETLTVGDPPSVSRHEP